MLWSGKKGARSYPRRIYKLLHRLARSLTYLSNMFINLILLLLFSPSLMENQDSRQIDMWVPEERADFLPYYKPILPFLLILFFSKIGLLYVITFIC